VRYAEKSMPPTHLVKLALLPTHKTMIFANSMNAIMGITTSFLLV